MRRQQGITLMELLVVMTVVAILSAIAYPNYRQYVMRANRASAKTALLSAAQNLERCFTRTNTYVGCVSPTGVPTVPFNTNDGNYNIAHASGSPSATAYSLVATPLGGQLKDTKCANFTLNQTGAQGVSGSQSAPLCWNK